MPLGEPSSQKAAREDVIFFGASVSVASWLALPNLDTSYVAT